MPELDPREAEILTYSYYRDAELRGANLLFLLMRMVEDPDAQVKLTEQLSDETRHAWLWTELIQQLGGEPAKVEDGYQVRIGKRAGRPRNIVDLLCLTIVVEQRALRQYHAHSKREGVPARTLEVLDAVTRDEGWHIDWIRKKARELAERDGDPDRVERALEKYRKIDREVVAEMKAMEFELTGASVSPA